MLLNLMNKSINKCLEKRTQCMTSLWLRSEQNNFCNISAMIKNFFPKNSKTMKSWFDINLVPWYFFWYIFFFSFFNIFSADWCKYKSIRAQHWKMQAIWRIPYNCTLWQSIKQVFLILEFFGFSRQFLPFHVEQGPYGVLLLLWVSSA